MNSIQDTFCALLLLLVFLAFPLVVSAEYRSEYFVIYESKGLSGKVINGIIQDAALARHTVTSHVSRPLMTTTEIVLCTTEREFREKTNFNSEHILASARPATNTIFINLSRLSKYPFEQLQRTLIHEYAHIYLGNMCARRLPRWLEEGVVMHLAGEWQLGDALALASARVSGKYIPLAQLEASFPDDPAAMRLAYLESYSLVSYILKSRYDKADIGVFVNDLTDSVDGEEVVSLFWIDMVRDGFEISWRKSTARTIRNWIFVLSSNAVFWFAVAMLFVFAYLKKRRKQNHILDEWEEEERIYSSLDDKDSFYAEH